MNSEPYSQGKYDHSYQLALCEKLLEEGKYDQALIIARRLAHHPAAGSVACDLHGQAAYRVSFFAESAHAFHRAIGYNPGQATLWSNLALAQVSLGRLHMALHAYDRGLALEPTNERIRFNQAAAQLTLGYWKQGFAGLRARHRFLAPPSAAIASLPEWDGIKQATVLVYGEQGFGDQILFARYLELFEEKLKSISCHIVLACSPPLIPLFEGNFSVGSLENPPFAEVRTALIDIPALLKIGPLSERIPYLPYKSPGKKLRGLTRSKTGYPHIGIAWAGSAKNSLNTRRSIPSKYLTPLIMRKDLYFVNLQHREDIDDWPWHESMIDHVKEITDFRATARILGELDLVISIDTALAHLAGAIGYPPLWVLLSQPADWRWASDDQRTKQSFWYPKARLFRQPQPGDWETVIARVNDALDHVIAHGFTPEMLMES